MDRLWQFSREWTDRDKLRLVVLLTHLIRDDILADRYGQPGRPNVQTLHELLAMSAAELETYRSEIEAYAREHEQTLGTASVVPS